MHCLIFLFSRELYAFDWLILDECYHTDCCRILTNYENVDDSSKMFNSRICERICGMSKTTCRCCDSRRIYGGYGQFYKDFGVGKLGLHKAFRVETDADGRAVIAPITKIAHVKLEDLVGYELAKEKLIANTEAFVQGRKANNCLLFGDAGTGKSSSIKGILNRYYEDGLRIIEVYKHQFQYLNDVIAQIKKPQL